MVQRTWALQTVSWLRHYAKATQTESILVAAEGEGVWRAGVKGRRVPLSDE